MASVCNFLQWRLVLRDTSLSLFYAILKNWVTITLVSETLLKNLANLYEMLFLYLPGQKQ